MTSEAAQAMAAGTGGAADVAVAGAGADAGAAPPSTGFCSGCSSESQDEQDMTIHLHHVHLNVSSREQSTAFYVSHLAAERVTLNGATEALHAAPVLLLMDESPAVKPAVLPSALQHIGWGSADPGAWYEQARNAGVTADVRGHTLFNTNEMPTLGEPGSGANTFALLGVEPPACYPVPDAFSYIYVLGPDQERIEIWSGVDMRVNHLHFTTADLAATTHWYERFLGLQMNQEPVLFSAFFLDDILFFFEPDGTSADYQVSDDSVLSHVGFSVANLDAWMARCREQNIEVVSGPTAAHGFRSGFVRGPDGLLIELVQAQPLSELCL